MIFCFLRDTKRVSIRNMFKDLVSAGLWIDGSKTKDDELMLRGNGLLSRV